MIFDAYALHFRDAEHREALHDRVSLIHPFYSKEIVELFLSTPAALLCSGQPKAVVRSALARRLAKESIERQSKAEFSFLWPLALNSLHQSLQGLDRLYARGWIERKKFETELQHALKVNPQTAAASIALLNRSWNILCLEALLRKIDS